MKIYSACVIFALLSIRNYLHTLTGATKTNGIEKAQTEMPRDYFEYTKEKLLSFQHQLTELLGADFPIPATKSALTTIQAIFSEETERLSTLSNFSPEIKKAACANANLKIKKFLPLLGFILRSTNVRNSFELTDPITRLAKRILKRDFVLSSEWDFSPLTYSFSFKELPDVILLGLPSFESANALIVPLAGHELGHWIWRHQDLENQLIGKLEENVLNFYRDKWSRFCQIFWEKDVGDIQTDTSIRDIWTISFADSIRQCEEVFADCMGLRLFGARRHSLASLDRAITRTCGRGRSSSKRRLRDFRFLHQIIMCSASTTPLRFPIPRTRSYLRQVTRQRATLWMIFYRWL
jgi:hypothetical protein